MESDDSSGPVRSFSKEEQNNSSQKKTLPASIESTSFVDDILTSIGFGYFQLIAFSLAGLTYFAFACEVLTFTFISIDVSKKWGLNGIEFAILPAVTCFTNMLGGAAVGYLGDRYGRVWPYVGSMALVGGFVLASAVSTTYLMLIVLRALCSIGIGGIITLLHPLLIEFLPIAYRGKVTMLTGFIQSLGSCTAGGMAWLLVPRYTYGWRLFIAFTAIPSITVLIFRLLFRVESPRHLISMNKADDAWKTLSLMAKINGKSLKEIIDKDEFFQYVNLNKKVVAGTGKCKEVSLVQKFLYIFRRPYSIRTMCLLVIYNTQQLAFFGSTLFLPVLLKNLNFDPYFISFTGFTAQIPGVLLISIITEWPEFGRINTLRLFTILSAVFFLLFAFVQNIVSIPLLTVFIYFSMTPINTLLLTYIPEAYPTDVRTMAVAFITTSGSINGMWLPFVSGYLADLSDKYPWLSPSVWGGVLVVQFAVSLILRHETRGKALDDTITAIN